MTTHDIIFTDISFLYHINHRKKFISHHIFPLKIHLYLNHIHTDIRKTAIVIRADNHFNPTDHKKLVKGEQIFDDLKTYNVYSV